MSPKQGWFESDEDYQHRVAQEADERTIENSTGSSPSKGWFESDDCYRDRIAQEANERRIEDSKGSPPSQGWFENDDNYRERISQEANESTIEKFTGSSPSQCLFESHDAYDTRIRKEANEHIVRGETGSNPAQGWFERNHDYRSRIAHEAREIRARESSNAKSSRRVEESSSVNYSNYQSSALPSETFSGTVGWILALAVIIFVVWIASNLDNGERATPVSAKSPEEIAEKQRQLEEKRKLARETLLRTFNFAQWNVGQSLEFQSSPISFCTRPCGRGATGPASIRLVSITKISTATISLRFSIKTTPKNQYLPGFLENRAVNDYLLFVKSDSYTKEGFGSRVIDSLYAEAMYLSDEQGKKYKSLSGIEGLGTTVFNRHAFSVTLPFDSESIFNVNFPIPEATSTSLKFVSPRLHGHQSEWYWTIYDSNQS